MNFSENKTLCLITGGSRGYGKVLSEVFSEKLGPGSAIILTARNREALEKIANLSKNKNIKIYFFDSDMSKPTFEKLDKGLCDLMIKENLKPDNFDQTLLIHNLGTLGPIVESLLTLNDFEQINEFLSTNVTSLVILTSVFFKNFPSKNYKKNAVVQITSIAAVSPIPFWDLYSAAKSARNSLMKSLNQTNSEITTLSWAPGPMETDMYHESVNNKLNQNLWSKKDYKPINIRESALKLVDLLEDLKFKSGEHIDFFDV